MGYVLSDICELVKVYHKKYPRLAGGDGQSGADGFYHNAATTGRMVLRRPVFRHPGTSMNEQQNRVIDIFTFDEHALLESINVNPDFLRNAARQRFPIRIEEGLGFSRVTPSQ